MANRVSDDDSYNRIFIIGARDVTSDEVTETFSNYGRVTDVYFPMDKATREKKGMQTTKEQMISNTNGTG